MWPSTAKRRLRIGAKQRRRIFAAAWAASVRTSGFCRHRPFTTLELAAIQSLVDPEEYLELDGLSDQDWRERVGNAVPSDAAQAIADTMYTTLLLAASGETFMLNSEEIWVRPIALALTLPRESTGRRQ